MALSTVYIFPSCALCSFTCSELFTGHLLISELIIYRKQTNIHTFCKCFWNLKRQPLFLETEFDRSDLFIFYYVVWASLVAQTVKRLSAMLETRIQPLGWEDPLEKEMAPHSSTLAWKIPWTEEPGRLQSTGSQRVRYDTLLLLYLCGLGLLNPYFLFTCPIMS